MDPALLPLYKLHKDFPSYPVPQLKYLYPPATQAIVQRIAQIMLREKAFYYQVLHLMNKFNLEVPFDIPYMNLDEIPLPESEEESELEEEIAPTKKRKVEKFYRKKIEIKINSTRDTLGKVNKASGNHEELVEIQEKPSEIIAPEIIPELPKKEFKILTQDEITSKKLTEEELSLLPIFLNYNPGEPSDKLYIKNLAKQVILEDLQEIFYFYSEPNQLEIKLMDKKGKMKGQAFITFKRFEDEELAEAAANLIEKARQETHGLFLKGKAMFVVYGKASKNYKKVSVI